MTFFFFFCKRYRFNSVLWVILFRFMISFISLTANKADFIYQICLGWCVTFGVRKKNLFYFQVLHSFLHVERCEYLCKTWYLISHNWFLFMIKESHQCYNFYAFIPCYIIITSPHRMMACSLLRSAISHWAYQSSNRATAAINSDTYSQEWGA